MYWEASRGRGKSVIVGRTRLYAVDASKSIRTGALAVVRVTLGILAASEGREQAVEAAARPRSAADKELGKG